MPDASAVDGGIERGPARFRARRIQPWWIAAAAILVAALVAVAEFAGGPGLGLRQPVPPPAVVRPTLQQKRVIASLTVDDQAQIVVTGKLAESRNAAIPLSGLPLEKVRGFALAAAAQGSAGTALSCLTQAVYYEAGFEPEAGKRAVAQVVLNRMRHPAYPKSVCGVVYQGSERRTGCQFSFTCDGSLLRAPGAAAWRAAQAVAKAALGGHVEASVGTATHYHADYVLPKWAFQLAKIEQIGAHIFYRFRGGWGTSRAFNGAYSGVERIPSLDYEALRQRQAGAGALVALPGEDGTTGEPGSAKVVYRKDPRDSGQRVNVTKLWQLDIPDPGRTSRARAALDEPDGDENKPLPISNSASSVIPEH